MAENNTKFAFDVLHDGGFRIVLETSNEKIGLICAAAACGVSAAVIFKKPILDALKSLAGLFSLSNNSTDPVIDDVELGSLIIKLRFFTPESFLKFLDCYESGLLKEALTKEFTKINILDESLPAEFRECLTGKDAQFDVNDVLTIKIRNEKEVENYRDKLKRNVPKDVMSLSSQTSPTSLRERLEMLVICPICLEQFKDPKVFPCLHSYCYKCIVKLAEHSQDTQTSLICPECRATVEIGNPPDVSSLSPNFITNNILATLALRDETESAAISCDNCDRGGSVETRCQDCLKFLCHPCTDFHKISYDTKAHVLLSKDELKSKKPSDNAKVMKCKQHTEKVVDLYCKTCQMTICVVCSVLDHQQHDFSSLKESISEAKDEVNNLLKEVKKRGDRLSKGLANAKEMTEDINARRQKSIGEINKFFTELEREIEIEKQNLIKTTNSLANSQESQLQCIYETLEMAQSTCNDGINFAEQALKNGNDVQILEMKQTITQRLGSLKDIQDDVNPSVGNPIRFLNDLSLMDIGKVITESCCVEEVATCPENCTANLKELGSFLQVGEKSVIKILCKDKDGRSIKSGGGRDRIEPFLHGVEVSDVKITENEDGSHDVTFVVNELGTLYFEATINGSLAPGCSLKEDVKWKISDAHGCGMIVSGENCVGFSMSGEGDVGKYCYRLGNSAMVSGIHNWKVEINHEVQSSDECQGATFEVGIIEDSNDYSEESIKSGKTKKWVYSEYSNKIRNVLVELDMKKRHLTTRASGKIITATSKFSIRRKTFEVTSEKVFPFFSVNCPHCSLTF